MTGASYSPWLFPERIRVQTLATGIADDEQGELHARTGFDDRGLRDSVMRTGRSASAEAATDTGTLRVRA